jgi:hypothetical protein
MVDDMKSDLHSIMNDVESITTKFELMSDDSQKYFTDLANFSIKLLRRDIDSLKNIISDYNVDTEKKNKYDDESEKINEIVKKLFIPYYLIANNLELSRTNRVI